MTLITLKQAPYVYSIPQRARSGDFDTGNLEMTFVILITIRQLSFKKMAVMWPKIC